MVNILAQNTRDEGLIATLITIFHHTPHDAGFITMILYKLCDAWLLHLSYVYM